MKADKDLYATPHERLAYVISEAGEAAEAATRLSAAAKDEKERVREEPGMEIYDVFWNPCDLAEISERRPRRRVRRGAFAEARSPRKRI